MRESVFPSIARRDSSGLVAVVWLWTHARAVIAVAVVSGSGPVSTLHQPKAVSALNQDSTPGSNLTYPLIQWYAVDIRVRSVITTRLRLQIAPEHLSAPRQPIRLLSVLE